MPKDIAYSLLAISALVFILGFVALLRQKTYLDSSTNLKTEIEVPFFGRMATNFPALVFAFIGAALAFVTASRSSVTPDVKVWSVRGPAVQFADGTEINQADWDAHFKVHISPKSDAWNVQTPKGRFTLMLPLIDGNTFEKAVQEVILEYDGEPYLTCSLVPEQEYKAWDNPQTRANSIISNASDGVRQFKTIKLAKPTEASNQSCKG